MLPRVIRWWIVVTTALAAPLVGACFDFNTAKECQDTYSCPPDAGDGGDAADAGDN